MGKPLDIGNYTRLRDMIRTFDAELAEADAATDGAAHAGNFWVRFEVGGRTFVLAEESDGDRVQATDFVSDLSKGDD